MPTPENLNKRIAELEAALKRGRYLVFGFDGYYPSGGAADLRGRFDTREEADAFAKTLRNAPNAAQRYEFAEVEDVQEMMLDA
jgi:hypothetical protein